jgi:hypothetical protein
MVLNSKGFHNELKNTLGNIVKNGISTFFRWRPGKISDLRTRKGM